MEIGNDLIIEDCVLNGLGVGLVVKEYVQPNLDSKQLFQLNTTFDIGEKDLVCCMKENHLNNKIINSFLELLK